MLQVAKSAIRTMMYSNIFLNLARPKKTISDVLFMFGVFFLLVGILIAGTFVFWTYYPNAISEVEKIIPDRHSASIGGLLRAARESTDDDQKHKYYSKLYSELLNVAISSKYYSVRKEAAQFLIQYYLGNNNKSEALEIAKYTEKKYPWDFSAKFKYVAVVSKINAEEAYSYYKSLYGKHADLVAVRNGFIEFLLSQSRFSEALEVANNNYVFSESDAAFQVFYNDNQSGFSEAQSVRLNFSDYERNNDNYKLSLSRVYQNLKEIRFDMDGLPDGTIVSSVKAEIQGQGINKTLQIKNVNDLLSLGDGGFQVNGNDPYAAFSIPKSLHGYKGEIRTEFRLKIDQAQLRLSDYYFEKILTNPEWQLFVDTGEGFNEKQSMHFSLEQRQGVFEWRANTNFNSMRKIRIDFPFFNGLKFRDIKIKLNGIKYFDKRDVISSQNILIEDGSLSVIGVDPHMVVDILSPLDMHSVELVFVFDDK